MHNNRLVDRFGRAHTYMRVAVTDRCNLRCRYCMPIEQIAWKASSELLADDEIVRLASVFASLGITKIRLTGGEPMVRPGIEHLIEQLSLVPGISIVAMTTNGTFLRDRAGKLKAAGLTALNVSLDTLHPDRFTAITGRDQLDDVLAGIDAALTAEFTPLRINTVVMKNVNDAELIDFVRFTSDRPVCVRFIEFMPSRMSRLPIGKLMSYGEMKERIASAFDLTPVVPAGDSGSSVAKEYTVAGHCGTIGFITPMTNHFCHRCNRLRLTADGHLKTCLFHPAETSLRDALRTGADSDELRRIVARTLIGKQEFPEPSDRIISANELGMYTVGG